MCILSRALRWDQPLSVEIETNGCAGSKDEIRYLEHVQIILTIEYTRRGDITIYLVTPMGTRSCLLPVRSEDSSDEGFKKWAFMTTHAWGEDPRGKWILEIKDGGESRSNTGTLRDWQLILHGTKDKPRHQNVTHPENPLHKKAVADDTKTNAKSSVQITQITYTFGENGAPSRTIVPPNNVPNLYNSQRAPTQAIMQNQQVAVQNQPSIMPSQVLNPYASLQQNFQNTASNGMMGGEYNYNTNAYRNYQRNNIPSYTAPNYGTNSPAYGNNHNYASLFTGQPAYNQVNNAQLYQQANNNPRTTLVGRSVTWTRPNPNSMQVYTNPNANLWDFFGHLNARRSAEEAIEKKKKMNSLIQLLARLHSKRQRR